MPRSTKKLIPLVAAAFLAACSQPFDGSGDPAPGPGGPLLDAFYLVQAGDLRGESVDGQPVVDLTRYGLLVCNAALDPDQVRAAAPQATILAYVDSHWVPLWGQGSPLWDDLRASFDSTDFWVDASGGRASTWPETEELLYTQENAATLAAFILRNLGGWDGIYIDDCWGSLATKVLQSLPAAPSDWPLVEQDWDDYMDTLVLTLRAGSVGLIVGNAGITAPDLRHLPLDGFASEEWWLPAYRDLLHTEFARYDPRLCVSWEFDAGDLARKGDIRYR